MNHTTFNFTSKDGLNLFGRLWTSPSPSPKGKVYLIHGLGEHTGRYADLAETFNQQGYHLAGFDLRGHGLSKGKRGHTPSYDHLLDDIQLFIKETQNRLPDNLPGFIYGHSLGGNLVLNFGLRRPSDMRGFIVTAPLIETAFEPPKAKLFAARVLSRIMPALTMKNGLERPALSRDQAIVEAYESDPYVHDLLSARLGFTMLESGKYALEHAAEWKAPLLLMHGTADRICSCPASEAFAQTAGTSIDLVLWEGGYHEIHNDLEKEKVILKMVHWMDHLTSTQVK
jgi:alpha-beta hydrolase superfamily lysophospholipase